VSDSMFRCHYCRMPSNRCVCTEDEARLQVADLDAGYHVPDHKAPRSEDTYASLGRPQPDPLHLLQWDEEDQR
jgi:hypothetical protein